MSNTDFSRDLAAYIASCRFEDLPLEASETAKKSLLDLIGVILAASGTVSTVRGVLDIVRESGGKPECTVLGFGDRVSPLMAALANGAMAHCLDFDDVAPDGNHASSTLIPAVLAAAEHKGGVSGKDIIKAIAIGQDVFLRIRRSLLGQRLDWLATTVIGVFSATAAAASVLGLDADQTANALGIASLGSCGTLEMRFGTGSDLGEIYAGFVAKSALLSTLLAQKGVTGTQSVFEGQAGIMNVYFGGQYDRARILAQLGSHFEGATMQYKPWPVCGIANTYIHAILEIMRGHDLTVGQIAEIRPYVGDFQQRMSYPLDQRRQPACSMDARFSMPFCLAVAAVHHEVGVAHFTTEALSDPAVLAAAKLVVPIDDAAYDWKTQMPDARIDVVLNDGRILTGTGAGTPGTAEHPMGWPELVEKFQNCAAFSAVPVSPEQVADVIEQMKRLDELVDGTAPIRALSPAS